MNLTTRVESWRAYWNSASDPVDVERQLNRLRWLEDFAIDCGSAIQAVEFRALQQQIVAGEKKLAELHGAFAPDRPQPQQPDWVNR